MRQYIVDAFTDEPFAGNPAAVCVMDGWPSDGSMMKFAMENNLSETAFVVKEAHGYRLRWFTPATEVELCGHATLALSGEMCSADYYHSIVPTFPDGALTSSSC